MYRILIVEDSPADERVLADHLDRYAREAGEAFSVDWHRSTAQLDEKDDPYDLIFLDIELPGQTGMEAAHDLRARGDETPIIFVTSLAQYAVEGYRVSALDFIVKPVAYGDLALRMGRAINVMRRRHVGAIPVAVRGATRLLSPDDLVFVDVDGHSLVYHLASGETLRARGSLSGAPAQLGATPFLRISASCIVNMSHVASAADASITLDTDDVVWASRTNKRRCLQELAAYLGGSL